MTQSGQGEEPSARPAHEGIVLPSDGGEPLLPGTTTGPGGPRHPAPPAGQTWGQPWGPDGGDQYQPPAQPPAQPQAQADGWGAPPAEQQWGGQPQGAPGPLPPEAAPAPSYGQPDQATRYLPPVQPAAPADEGATQYLPPVPSHGGPQPADEGATQYIPPVAPGALPPEMPPAQQHGTGQPHPAPQPYGGHHAAPRPPAETTQYLGRAQHPGNAPAGPDAEATQYIPPVAGGAPYGHQGEDRQPPAEFEGLFRSDPGGGAPADATQQLPVFEEPPAHYPAQPGHYSAQPAYDPPGGGRGRRALRDDDGGGRGGRTGSKVPMFAAVGIAIAVVGVGAGALLGGGDGDEQTDGSKTVSATAPATEETSASPSPTVDPARQQAEELDKLLADSGNSRAAVIKAVGEVKSCTNLAGAAKSLREAARQRDGLVTSLSALAVDKLPNHAELTTALTKAWQASASADNHYAAWADQVAGNKKLCRKGQASGTGQTAAGNRQSGIASAQKTKAAGLWNSIAKPYGLTERQPTQL
ncbi:hypothetical protein [Streptomyces sp. NPDC006997]|uniref:hypothetical protein n=1 Tax=Streptomyces sp. NPDC006997 TaxID=3155356 RepID=UPI0033E978F8